MTDVPTVKAVQVHAPNWYTFPLHAISHIVLMILLVFYSWIIQHFILVFLMLCPCILQSFVPSFSVLVQFWFIIMFSIFQCWLVIVIGHNLRKETFSTSFGNKFHCPHKIQKKCFWCSLHRKMETFLQIYRIWRALETDLLVIHRQ